MGIRIEVFQHDGKYPESQLELNTWRVVSFRGGLRCLRNSFGMRSWPAVFLDFRAAMAASNSWVVNGWANSCMGRVDKEFLALQL